jgi:hypothetical protein
MALPNGANLAFTVETPGFTTQSENVSLPFATSSKPYRQTIGYDDGKLTIINYFDEAASDDNYRQYLALIEKKAKLEVNEGENKLTVPAVVDEITEEPVNKDTAVVVKNTIQPTIIEEEGQVTPQKSVDNNQLAAMARGDANELHQEARQLAQDAMDAESLVSRQKEDAGKKLAGAQEALKAADAMAEGDEKNIAIEKSNALQRTAEIEDAIADRIASLAASLRTDAANREKEATLNDQYAKELERSVSGKNSNESLTRLEAIEAEIAQLSGRKTSSDNMITILKTDIDQKEKDLAGAEQAMADSRTALDEIRTEIGSKENELANTKKKSKKEAINSELTALKSSAEEKETELRQRETETARATDELLMLKSELDVTNVIKTSDIAAKEPVKEVSPENSISSTATTAATVTPNAPVNAITNAALKEKYTDLMKPSDPENTSALEENILQLNNYNSEIDKAITDNKSALAKTINEASKKQISAEITKLEGSKKQNTAQIASNKKQLSTLGAVAAEKPAGNKETFAPIVATSPGEAMAGLEKLSAGLATNADNFKFSEYSNPEAQALKAEADQRLNDAIAKQKKLQEDITISKQSIRKNAPVEEEPQNVEQLTRQSEQLMAEASRIRARAKAATGAEKDKLVTQARALEEQATDKNLQASEITGYDNTFVFDTNKENIQALLAENKTSDTELEQVKKLNEEAEVAFRQAIDIRVEAISLTSKAAKMGNFGNAQEKEAEAILKQQQAVEILMSKSPDFKLKSAVTSSSGGVTEPESPGASLPELVEAVNASLADVVNARIASYEKLFEANTAEYTSLSGEINSSGVLNTNPRYKTIYLSAEGKADNATKGKQTADNSNSPNEKLDLLAAAVKLQDEALLQLRGIAPQVVASANTGGNKAVNTPGNGAASSNTVTTGTIPDTQPKVPATVINPVIVSLSGNDTTTGAVLNYLDNNSIALKNSQAGTDANNAITELKKTETERQTIEEEISSLANANASPETLKSQAASLRTEGEDYLAKAANDRSEAESKEGEERDLLALRAQENETRGQQKMLEAAALTKQANGRQLQANSKAIEEMLGQLKLDDKDAVDELDPLTTDVNGLKFQAEKLREEANQIDNPGAKLGAISNAEEKENELLNKQKELIAALNEEYPNYKMSAPWTETTAASGVPADLAERKSGNVRRQHEQLTNLTNAFTLEYESSKNLVSANLTPEQQNSKRDADLLNTESKKLLVSSAREKNEGERTKLLNMAAKAGNAAVQQLYKLIPPNAVVAAVNESPAPVEPKPTAPEVTTAPRNTSNAATVKVEGLEVIRGNAYNSNKPIPIDAAIGEGLSFRVQIGAFKTRIPDNAFKGLSPLNGETTNSGYIRYTAGNFNKMENANAVKNDLRSLGYNDAFVVAYFNGKRISIAEALVMLKNEGRTPDPNAPSSAGITANTNIPGAAVNSVFAEKVNAGELEKTNGLLYTIQIGVYNRQVTAQQLLNLRPLFTEQLPNGLYRYTAGIYNNAARLNTDKQQVVDLGVRDAFISAYINGKKIPVTEARNRQANDVTIKLEAEDPIVFPGSPAAPVTAVQPFSNGVSSYPAPTAENGVKPNEEGICYKVQIGAYSRQLPDEVAQKFSAIKSWPVENRQVNGLYIYNIGNFSSSSFAKTLKEEANRVGIDDAFITVYQDGRKLSGAEALQYLNR